MQAIADLFSKNMIAVFFVYGLSWFVMGLAVALVTRKGLGLKMADSLPWLAAFGITHGFVEWGDMLKLAQVPSSALSSSELLPPVKTILLGLSTVFLVQFGAHLLANTHRRLRWLLAVPPLLFIAWIASPLVVPQFLSTGGWQAPPSGACLQCHTVPPVGGTPPAATVREAWLPVAEVWARYLLYMPGLVLSALGLWQQAPVFRAMNLSQTARDTRLAAVVLVINVFFAGLVVAPAPYFPASILNYHTFVDFFPVPPQVFRAGCALLAAVFIVRMMRVFEREHERQLEVARQERQQVQAQYLREVEASREELARLNRELEERVQERTRGLATLVESAKTLASTLELNTLLATVMREIGSIVGSAEAGILFLYDEGSNCLMGRSSFGCVEEAISKLGLEPGEMVAGKVFGERRGLVSQDGDEIDAVMSNLSGENWGLLEAARRGLTQPRNVICVPLEAKDRAIGSLLLVNVQTIEGFPLELLGALADQIALAVDNARLYEEVQRKEHLRGQLLEMVIVAQEEERRRVARELHDEAGQILSAVMMSAAAAEEVIPIEMGLAREKLMETRTLAAQALADVRKLVLDLRPEILDDLGLVPALRWYIRNRLEPAGIKGHLETSGLHGRLAPRVEVTVFRVIQEAATNVVRHSQAKNVRVRLERQEGRLKGLVEDDGNGFAMTAVQEPGALGRGWGLRGMEERVALLGGSFKIESHLGEGTRVFMEIPLEGRRADLMSKIRILIVDDHGIVRAGIKSLLETQPDIEVVGEAAEGKEAIEKTRQLRPDVVLMDIAMPGMNGLEATREIKRQMPESCVLALTMQDNEEYFFPMLSAGASGYVLKEASSQELLTAVRAVYEGGAFLSPVVARAVLEDYLQGVATGTERDSYANLSQREKEVLKLAAEGKTNREMAEALFLSTKTIEKHRATMMHKLGLVNRSELVRYAIRKGLIELEE